MSEISNYSPGLEGVIGGESSISRIDVERNRLIIRGYDLVDLTEGATYEETAYLLLYDDLPNSAQLEEFCSTLVEERKIPDGVMNVLKHAPSETHPMGLLRTAISSLASYDVEVDDNSHDANVRKAIRLIAKAPTLISAGHRFSQGKEPVTANENLGHAANFLYMMTGSDPGEHEVSAMNVSMILYAEHGFNASTFAARVTASTLSDLHSAVTSGVGTLAGPLHGGANEQAMLMLLEIEDVSKAEKWIYDALAAKKKIMGFGHREYKSGDSRVPSMKKVAREIADATGSSKWVDIGDIVEKTMIREKSIHPNVDFPCGYAYYMMEIPIPLYTPIFVASRLSGWCAHVIEQHDNNRLIRPGHIYTGFEHKVMKSLIDR